MKKIRKRMAVIPLVAALVILTAMSPAPGEGASGGAADPYYYFNGTGRAHGVGMCMDGVYYMAQAGHGYRAILNFYYTGITFSRTDENRPVRVRGRDGQIRTWTMREYLRRLQEEPDHYPIEELKALYVAARTYTLSVIARGKHAAGGFDICSSGDCCQACDENKTVEKYPNCNAAVDATAGEIMTYDGQPIIAAYCGSCGGHTENNEDVWSPRPIPYLRGKPDPYCHNSPRYAWGGNFRKSDIEARLNSRSDTAVGTLHVMDLSNRTPGGRVRTARLVGSSAIKTVPGSTIQALLGFQSTKFHLLLPNFDQYILVLNPNPEPTPVTFTFMLPDGTSSTHAEEVPADSRFTVKVNDCLQFQEISTRVVSDLPVIAERAMYFDYGRRFTGGSASAGTPAPGPRWHFAEGYTGGGFETYILVQNPQPDTAELKFTFMLPGGATVERTATAGPFTRLTLAVDGVPGLEDAEVSTLVECTSGGGVVAERSSYFDYYGRDGGANSPGVAEPSETWYLAEGYTGRGFDTFVVLQNPSDRAATVEAAFMKEDGKSVRRKYAVPARARHTVHADLIPGLEDAGFSTVLASTNGVGIIAERAMYFDYDGRGLDDGHSSPGVPEPAETWHLAEGYTGGRFDTWVVVGNPEAREALVEVAFSTPGGRAVTREYAIKARSRFTIPVDGIEGLESAEVSTTVRSKNGAKVVAERSMYFVYSDGYCSRDGGHNATGVRSPARTWYFAEGYTGF